MLNQPPTGILSCSFLCFIEGSFGIWQAVKILDCGIRYIISGFLSISFTPSPTVCLISAFGKSIWNISQVLSVFLPFYPHLRQWAKNPPFVRIENNWGNYREETNPKKAKVTSRSWQDTGDPLRGPEEQLVRACSQGRKHSTRGRCGRRVHPEWQKQWPGRRYDYCRRRRQGKVDNRLWPIPERRHEAKWKGCDPRERNRGTGTPWLAREKMRGPQA